MKFKVGDEIKHKDFGVGKIVYINEEINKSPYAVQFETFNKDLHSLGIFGAPEVKMGHGMWCKECDLKLVEEAPKNLIPQIAEMLGVEIGEEFGIKEKAASNRICKFTDMHLVSKYKGEAEWSIALVELGYLLSGKWHIKKLFNKPHLTEDEKTILRNLPKEYKWIARDRDNELSVYDCAPRKHGLDQYWKNVGDRAAEMNLFQHLFQFIKWEDEEAYNIEELLKE